MPVFVNTWETGVPPFAMERLNESSPIASMPLGHSVDVEPFVASQVVTVWPAAVVPALDHTTAGPFTVAFWVNGVNSQAGSLLMQPVPSSLMATCGPEGGGVGGGLVMM